MSRSQRTKKSPQHGFTLIEVMIALTVLAVGLLGVASLAATMLATADRSKYMTLASTLASEKLEDLNRWYGESAQVCVPGSTASVGSLTSDVIQTTTCDSGDSATVAYYDEVSIGLADNTGDCPGSTAGCFAEIVSSQSAGETTFTTTSHSPDGQISVSTSNTAPGNAHLHRRWIIEKDTPISGVQRITVAVTVLNDSLKRPVTFQMSMVRP
jgi:prepilin-type N-terminal cleavage/methylation domain-containing protein